MSSNEEETTMELTSSTVRPNSTPKLSLFSLPKKQAEPAPGMLTPPLQAEAAVPFNWEEAPGRPKPPGHGGGTKPASARCLDLPPRMLTFDSGAKLAGTPSPTTVFDGPEFGGGVRSISSTWSSFREEGRSKRFEVKEKVGLGSSRWGILKGRSKGGGRVCEEEEEESLGNILSAVLGGDGGCGGGGGGGQGETKVKINRVKRSGSFFSPSHSKSKSHLWTSIYESIKQVVPWRRGQRKEDEKSAQPTAVRSADFTV